MARIAGGTSTCATSTEKFCRLSRAARTTAMAFAGAVVIGFTMPQTALSRGHIYVDFLIAKFSQRVRNAYNITTRCVVFILFFLTGWNLFKYGWDLQRSGEVSPTLQMPFYPVAYGVGICCFVQCLVMICDLMKIHGGRYDE